LITHPGYPPGRRTHRHRDSTRACQRDDPEMVLVMRHATTATDALKAKLRVAAKPNGGQNRAAVHVVATRGRCCRHVPALDIADFLQAPWRNGTAKFLKKSSEIGAPVAGELPVEDRPEVR
jgi:hypothetical protein